MSVDRLLLEEGDGDRICGLVEAYDSDFRSSPVENSGLSRAITSRQLHRSPYLALRAMRVFPDMVREHYDPSELVVLGDYFSQHPIFSGIKDKNIPVERYERAAQLAYALSQRDAYVPHVIVHDGRIALLDAHDPHRLLSEPALTQTPDMAQLYAVVYTRRQPARC